MKTVGCAIASAFLLLSAVLCQFQDEEYANVNCLYQWGGVICDCENLKYLMRLPTLNGNHKHIHVRDCENLFVPTDSLRELWAINDLKFENIGKLDLREFSFNSTRQRPSMRVEIINSTVPNLPSHFIKGNLDELLIRDSIIEKIHIFALTGLTGEVSTIRINNSQIGEIETEAFRKLTIHNLEIIDTTFKLDSVSRTFYDCIIHNVIIESSRFTFLHSSTFAVKEVQRLRIFNSTFGIIEGEAFMMDVSDRAIFSNNTVSMLSFAAFRGITMNPITPTQRTKDVYFEFNNNHVNFINPEDQLYFCPDMTLQLSKLYLWDPSRCEAVAKLHELKFFNDNSNTIFMRIEDENFESISYLNDRCRTESNWFWLLLIILGVVVMLVILIPAIFCYLRKRKRLDIIMPEPRTYRQTQIVMKVETCGLIKTDF